MIVDYESTIGKPSGSSLHEPNLYSKPEILMQLYLRVQALSEIPGSWHRTGGDSCLIEIMSKDFDMLLI